MSTAQAPHLPSWKSTTRRAQARADGTCAGLTGDSVEITPYAQGGGIMTQYFPIIVEQESNGTVSA
jgi:hypothetical protein